MLILTSLKSRKTSVVAIDRNLIRRRLRDTSDYERLSDPGLLVQPSNSALVASRSLAAPPTRLALGFPSKPATANSLSASTSFSSQKALKSSAPPFKHQSQCSQRTVGTDDSQECPDHLLTLNQRHPHLIRVLKEYTHYYNTARPHQGLTQQIPIPLSRPQYGAIHCRNVLGSILHDCYCDAA